MTCTTLLETDLNLLLPLKQDLDWAWICITLVRYEKYPANFADNSRTYSYFSNGISAWLINLINPSRMHN